MKRILACFIVLLTVGMLPANTATVTTKATTTAKPTDWTSQAGIDKLNMIGSSLLSANKLPTNVKFVIDQKEDINAYANSDREVHVYLGLLKIVRNNDELAAIVAHEISHIVLAHSAKQTLANVALGTAINVVNTKVNNDMANYASNASAQLVSTKLSRTEEFEADLIGTELLVKAGYNPLGMISVLQLITTEYIDMFSTHPSGDKRVQKVYDFVAYNYPDSLKKGFNTQEYKSFLADMQPILDERKANPKVQAKFEKEQKKLKEKRIKQAKKMRNSSNPWDTSLNILNAFSS